MSVTKLADLPPPTGADLVAASSPYRIGPFDKLDIGVFGVPELSGKFLDRCCGTTVAAAHRHD